MRAFKTTYRDRTGKVREASKWYIEFKDHLETIRRLPAFTDRKLSEALGRQIERLVASRVAREPLSIDLSRWIECLPQSIREKMAKIGLLDDQRLAATKSLSEHLADFEASLKAGGDSIHQVNLKATRLKRIFDECGFKFWTDISATGIERFLEKLRTDVLDDKGKITTKGISNKTSNYYLGCVKHFCRWMIADGRASVSPVARLKELKTDEDAQQRRALTVVELRNLLDAAYHGKKVYGINGYDRYMLYKVAVETGLRSNELRNLTPLSFTLDGERPEVRLPAQFSKHRKDDILPLRKDTAAELKGYLAMKLPTAPAFNMPSPSNVVRMFRVDLKAAKIDEKDSAGRKVVFHSLRHTFVTNLSRGGVHPKTAQELARHSKIDLTMNVYTHSYRGELAGAVAALPNLSLPEIEKNKNISTGTDGAINVNSVLAFCLAPEGGKSRILADSDGQHVKAMVKTETGDSTAYNASNRPNDVIYDAHKKMGRVGVEPTTHGFSVHCSTT
jgi:integrase/recombinase XerD